jgi:uncharacterized damage-inducible protein DinB
MTPAARFRELFTYERDAHAKVMASLGAVPLIKHSQSEYLRALQLVAHIEVARRFWLFRLGANEARPADFFPKTGDLAALSSQLAQTENKWAAYLDTLDDAAMVRVIEYESTEGQWYTNTVEEVLTQLYGHSLYHRGQIAMLLRTLGCQPAETDYIYYARRPIDAPAGKA